MPEFTFDGGYSPGGPDPLDRVSRAFRPDHDAVEHQLDPPSGDRFQPAPRPGPVPASSVPSWNPQAGLTVRNKLTKQGPYVLVQRHESPPGVDLPVLVPSVEDRHAYKMLKVDDAWVVRNRRDEDLVIPTACLEPYEPSPGIPKRVAGGIAAVARAVPKELLWVVLAVLLSLASSYGMLHWGPPR